MNPLAIIEAAVQILAAVAKLVPEIQKDIGTLSGNDLAALEALIVQLHSDSQALTAQLDALKSQ